MIHLALFITLAGFVIGLGAVTVIDWHGFLARRSSYWTEATIRSHKITKPLIWLGTLLVLIGHWLLYQAEVLSWPQVGWRLLVLAVMVINGAFLSFVVSPELLRREAAGQAGELLPLRLQIKITVSFVISFCSWWGLLAALVWVLV